MFCTKNELSIWKELTIFQNTQVSLLLQGSCYLIADNIAAKLWPFFRICSTRTGPYLGKTRWMAAGG